MFLIVVDFLVDFELFLRIKCVVRRLFFFLMIYVWWELEKVYNVIMLEEIIVENLKFVVVMKYNILIDFINSF